MGDHVIYVENSNVYWKDYSVEDAWFWTKDVTKAKHMSSKVAGEIVTRWNEKHHSEKTVGDKTVPSTALGGILPINAKVIEIKL